MVRGRAPVALGLLAVLLLPHVCSSDVTDDADGTSGAAEEAHELLRRGSGQVCAPSSRAPNSWFFAPGCLVGPDGVRAWFFCNAAAHGQLGRAGVHVSLLVQLSPHCQHPCRLPLGEIPVSLAPRMCLRAVGASRQCCAALTAPALLSVSLDAVRGRTRRGRTSASRNTRESIACTFVCTRPCHAPTSAHWLPSWRALGR